ncbi:MAG: hypothetical protein K5651_07360 [Bacteroidales bacterium]|nr:hypothetical protein [Bacteroidales bacterium]
MKNFDAEKWLEQAGKKRPYQLPDGYFEDFRKQMDAMARNASSEGRDTKTVPVSVWTRMRPILAMAASFVLLVALGGLLLKTVTPTQTDLGEDTYYSYYCDVIPRSDADAIYFSQTQEQTLSEEEIVSYLNESDIDIEFYMEESSSSQE